MPPRPLRRRVSQVAAVKTGHDATDRAIDALREPLDALLLQPLPRAIATVRLVSGLNKIAHGIGEVPRGFLATHDTPGAEITAEPGNPVPDRQLWVRLSGAAQVNAFMVVF